MGGAGQPGVVHPASPASRASPVDIVAAGPSAPRRLLEQLPSVTGPVEALARVEFCGQGVDLIAELG
ncbi:PE-PGRS family protein [Mycobacterium tuberculosis]|nr:PE-PGRS family protein [Mycobacterium tuberculosis]